MERYRYLVVGGGMTADAAIRGIREADPDGTIGLVGSEPEAPYKRPPLSKGLWKGDPDEEIWYWTERHGATLHLGRRIRSLDLKDHTAVGDGGEEYGFDKLLLATGATPRRLPYEDERIIHFRTVGDYNRLRKLTERGKKIAVVGGGFIGMEIAAALALNDCEVTMYFPQDTLGARIFPESLGLYLNDYYRHKGVELLAGATVTRIESRGIRLLVRSRAARSSIETDAYFDGIVAGIGVVPNVELARDAGLAIGNGIRVDEFLRTSHPDVYAAGDVAEFFNPAVDRRIRVEHEDNARAMGRAAGLSMAGRPEPYRHLPSFYSDLFELGFEAVGLVDSSLECVADWKTENRKGVLYYLQDRRVRGVLLWNVWNQVDAARALIAEPGPFRVEDIHGRLPARKAA